MKPDDPLCQAWDLVTGDESEPGISISTAARATAQARYAAESGLAFQEVQCLRVYVHIYTRQEAWEEYGRERAIEQRQEEKGVGWYFGPSLLCPAPGVTAEGYYYDDVDAAGLHKSVTSEDWAWIEGVPSAVPDDWEPDENDPAWFRTTRDDPRAIPAWESDEF